MIEREGEASLAGLQLHLFDGVRTNIPQDLKILVARMNARCSGKGIDRFKTKAKFADLCIVVTFRPA